MRKKTFKFIIIFFIVVIIFLLILTNVLKNKNADKELSDEQIELDMQKQEIDNMKKSEESVIKNKLSNMTERERMEYYFSCFISQIEAKNYENAYNMLYDEFKGNYFAQLNDFEIYAKQKFPKMMNIEHTNFERSGDIYIMFVTINDALSMSSEHTGLEMKFVIKETAINKFVMSFSVI